MTIASRFACVLPFVFVACGDDRPGAPSGTLEPRLLDEAERKDPTACASCHPAQVDEWSASVHAHSSRDPVFLAMNRRGQEETHGDLGPFCVKCHAPVAYDAGLTEDGLNLESLPEYAQGVT